MNIMLFKHYMKDSKRFTKGKLTAKKECTKCVFQSVSVLPLKWTVGRPRSKKVIHVCVILCVWVYANIRMDGVYASLCVCMCCVCVNIHVNPGSK